MTWGALGERPDVVYQDDAVILINARWQDVVADIPTVDAVITDPPYSDRTHSGQRTGSSLRMPTIGYAGITEDDARWMSRFMVQVCPNGWHVVFCDHLAFRWHEAAADEAGRMVFAPVFLRENPTPRFSGDGPALALEFMCVSRARKRTVCGSLPGYYPFTIGQSGKGGRTVAGAKPLPLMRAVVSDYSRPGDLILDPCAGGGTTAVAARLEGRRCILIEQDPATAALAAKRLHPYRDHRASDAQIGMFDV